MITAKLAGSKSQSNVSLIDLVEKNKFPFLITNEDGTNILMVVSKEQNNSLLAVSLAYTDQDYTCNEVRTIKLGGGWKFYKETLNITLLNNDPED